MILTTRSTARPLGRPFPSIVGPTSPPPPVKRELPP
ncbi:uncharacterized protein J3R85_000356 [Psidium guajava]|nr:uncharacterized protein J3R85_000356 [Psidium guajava]